MHDLNKRKSIAVVGGGITGIAAALELAKSGFFNVTIFEKENQLGGLSSFYKWHDVICDRFYHVVLAKDTYLLDFIRELNLESEFYWCRANSGFYGDRKLVSFSSSIDFLQFPFLTIWQKFRLALGILYIATIRKNSKIDEINAPQWLTKIFGLPVYQNIWEPLLRSKLGEAKDRTSAAFIWVTIKRLYGTRSFAAKHEKMGHVRGKYHTILSAAQKKLSELYVKIILNAPVLKVRLINNSNFPGQSKKPNVLDSHNSSKQIVLTTNIGDFKFDKVLFTIPCAEILKIFDNIDNHPYWEKLKKVEYIGIACVLTILSRKLSPYYVINLLNKEFPFTGIIEATNIASPEEIVDKHFIYLPKYLPDDDPMNDWSDDQIKKIFIEKLKTVFFDLKKEEILHLNIFREKYVFSLQDANYLQRTVGFRTPLSNIYLANNSMIYNSTLNNNAAIKIAKEAAGTIIADSKKII